jgi:hypothetical protein
MSLKFTRKPESLRCESRALPQFRVRSRVSHAPFVSEIGSWEGAEGGERTIPETDYLRVSAPVSSNVPLSTNPSRSARRCEAVLSTAVT